MTRKPQCMAVQSIVALLLVMAVPLLVLAAPPTEPDTISSRIEVRVETFASRAAGTVEPCKAAQSTSRSLVPLWSTFGEVRPEKSGEGFELVAASTHCGIGAFPGVLPPLGEGPVPFLILEMSASSGWDPAPMDPGPVTVAQIGLVLTSQQLTGFSPEGKPLYSAPVIDRRTTRLGEGEEFMVPLVLADARDREILGVQEVVVRIRAGQASRSGATDYGTLSVMAAAPDSEILIDGGVAGRVGADGSGLLPTIPVGQREVRLRSASGQKVMRMVTVVKGRTVIVSPEAGDGSAPAPPVITPIGENSRGFLEFRRVRDGAVMVQIPAGEFLMGNLEAEGAPLPHTVDVSSFLMDKLPVTVELFKRFAAATGRPLPPEPYWGFYDDHPVAFVRWDEGRAYCEWAGARLPTEAEREKSARGTDGRKFPWGNEEPSPERAVFRRNWGYEGNDTVGVRPAGASPYGLLDTGGNMWEFCEDWWDLDYFKTSPQKDPAGPKTGRAHVVKGGSWDSRPTLLSASSRNFAYIGYREGDFGFRCAMDSVDKAADAGQTRVEP